MFKFYFQVLFPSKSFPLSSVFPRTVILNQNWFYEFKSSFLGVGPNIRPSVEPR